MATETARTGTIYALVDPTAPSWDRAVRYIGKTVQPIRTRLGSHLRDAKYKPKTRCNWWLRGLTSRGVAPHIEPLAVVAVERLDALECWWIKRMREAGGQLLNLTEGGSGMVPLPDLLERIKAKAKETNNRPDVRARHSADSIRQWSDPEIRSRRVTAIRDARPKKAAAIAASWRDPEIADRRRAGLKRKEARKHGDLWARIVEARTANSTWSIVTIAKHCGCHVDAVRATLRREGLQTPKMRLFAHLPGRKGRAR